MFDYLGEKVGALSDSINSLSLFEKKKKEAGFGDMPEFASAHNAPQAEADPNASAFASDFGKGGYGGEPSAFRGYFQPSSTTKADPTAFDKNVGWNKDKVKEGMSLGPGTYEEAKEEWGDKVPWQALGDVLKSIKPNPEQAPQATGHRGGRFNFDRNLYENPLLTREYNQLYAAPLYTPLTK